jgi:outer membrane protein assembly factor BamE
LQPTTDKWLGVITPYRIDIMQGNVVTQELAAQRRSIVAIFKDNKLDKLEAPDLPSEVEFVGSVRPKRSGGAEPVLALTDEQKKALPPPVKTETPATVTPQGAVRPYPPLEPA